MNTPTLPGTPPPLPPRPPWWTLRGNLLIIEERRIVLAHVTRYQSNAHPGGSFDIDQNGVRWVFYGSHLTPDELKKEMRRLIAALDGYFANR